jgi:hypothetical protein
MREPRLTEDLYRKIYDLETYYANVDRSYPDGVDKEIKLREIQQEILSYEKKIYHIDTERAIKMFEYTLYVFAVVVLFILLFYVVQV